VSRVRHYHGSQRGLLQVSELRDDQRLQLALRLDNSETLTLSDWRMSG